MWGGGRGVTEGKGQQGGGEKEEARGLQQPKVVGGPIRPDARRTLLRGREQLQGEPSSGRTVSKGYTLLLARLEVQGCRRKRVTLGRLQGKQMSLGKAMFFRIRS